jgi:hypothetical protein
MQKDEPAEEPEPTPGKEGPAEVSCWRVRVIDWLRTTPDYVCAARRPHESSNPVVGLGAADGTALAVLKRRSAADARREVGFHWNPLCTYRAVVDE